MIKDVNITSASFDDGMTFGHTFTLSYNVSEADKLEVLWFEKADKAYDIGRDSSVLTEPDKWGEMCSACKEYSPVFADILDCQSGVEGAFDVEMNDDPHIKSDADTQRTLEFYIVLKDEESAFIITATQKLKMNATMQITEQSFAYDINAEPDLTASGLIEPVGTIYDVTEIIYMN